MSAIIIAIDGFSACGKSTLARALAARLGYAYVDTGAMYRAVTLYLLDHQIPIDDETAVFAQLARINIHFKQLAGCNTVFLNGEAVENQIRSLRVSGKVSEVAAISAVRRFLVAQQQKMGQDRGLVMDGRDIGTVVFPDAELKIFMEADFAVRSQRRLQELGARAKGISAATIEENLRHRDHIDSTRADSPLRRAEDARILDNTKLSPEEQLVLALSWAREAGA